MTENKTLPNPVEEKATRINRRTAIKTLGMTAAAMVLPPAVANWTSPLANAQAHSTHPHTKATHPHPNNPKWYGFNLLEYFSTDPDWMKYFPYKNDGMFLEDDFRWIRDWGFNWVRLPMDYRFWTDPRDLLKIDDAKVAPIDRAIKLGEQYGIHINLSLHRAPGYCILDTLDESLTGIHVTKEQSSVFAAHALLDAFLYQWTYFAQRYKGISSEKLSFNLVNEPLVPMTAAETEDITKACTGPPREALLRKFAKRHSPEYTHVARAAIAAISKNDPQRLVVSDGNIAATSIIPGLFGTGALQSCHTYHPVRLTHYQCEWARGLLTGKEPLPTWPLKESNAVVVDRAQLADTFKPWKEPAAHGVPIHFGEMGCYKHTPPQVVNAWFDDTLSVIGDLQSGWALWNFRGPFGVLDTERDGTQFEDWHGHKLDRALLTILQKKMQT